jgi:hypothetical protein
MQVPRQTAHFPFPQARREKWLSSANAFSAVKSAELHAQAVMEKMVKARH